MSQVDIFLACSCVTFSVETGMSSPQIGNPQQSIAAKQKPSLLACGVLGSRGAVCVKVAHRSMNSSAQPRLGNSSESTRLELLHEV